ncbi:head-tail connector protein [Butyricicoccus porcorum]|uniref:head-tail connector protein n=1 Tax=Butyricicoccus porcorum TaxID=1945634 RepID=UPI00235398FD|nr:head-tail connector protein [Butyricicoccus porcorum]
MMDELLEVKAYLRIDGSGEDDLLQSLIASAEAYMAKSGVPEQPEDPTWKLLRNVLVLHFYDRRDSPDIPAGARGLLLQLRSGGSG